MSNIHLAHKPLRAVATEALHLHHTHRSPMRIPRPDLVARVVSFLRTNVGEPVTVAEMSGMAGVSERTLRAAFRDVIGLSPKQYAITERLRAAHDALCAADPKTTTVTDIAMAHGFFELGRFAGRYRHTFGEAPSRTLRQVAAAASWPEQAA
jgi:AraC family ethanolamine operon transcriptional activator